MDRVIYLAEVSSFAYMQRESRSLQCIQAGVEIHRNDTERDSLNMGYVMEFNGM